MAKNNNLQDFLTDIANTIREENGTTALINPQDFRSKIIEIGNKLRRLISGTLGEIKETDLQGIKDIKPYAFYYDAFIKSVSIPNSVTSIGKNAFSNCIGLTSVTIPENITSIGSSAFHSCLGLTAIAIPSSITSISSSMLDGCTGLTSITIPNSVTSIGDNAFATCKSLTSVTIPDSVTSINSSAFFNCTGLTSVTIGNGITSISSSVFNNCSNLTSVVYKGNVLISAHIFKGCTKIAKYDFRNATSIPTLSNKAYLGYAAGCKIIVPDALHDSWKAATNWSALTDVVWVKASEYTEE